MKTRILLFACLILVLGVSIGLTSCKKDDAPKPEIVQDEVAYFIVGEVISDEKPLDGVAVSADGQETTTGSDGKFELKVTKKGDFNVSFAKTGYITVTAEASIASNAQSKAVTTIRQSLTKKSDPVMVRPDEETSITHNQTGVTFFAPAGSVKEPVDITMTSFIPGVKNITSGSAGVSLAALNLEPDGLVFENPVEITLANPAGDKVHFGNLKHVIERNSTQEEVDDVTYDSETNTYKIALTGFSNHAVVVGATVAVPGITTELLDTKVIDNLGNMAAKSEIVSMTQKYGWAMDENLAANLKASYPVLTDASVNGLVASFTTAVSSLMGSTPGTGELSLSIPFYVSGDTKLTIEFYAQVETKVFTFPLIFVDGGLEWVDVSAKRYLGTEVRTTYQNGSSHPDHTGGSGQ
jgi:hypothetical protein